MKVLTKEEVSNAPFIRGRKYLHAEIAQLSSGEAIEIGHGEWPMKSQPINYYSNLNSVKVKKTKDSFIIIKK
jgi:hypothetical protein